jgi:hypothetical protein
MPTIIGIYIGYVKINLRDNPQYYMPTKQRLISPLPGTKRPASARFRGIRIPNVGGTSA